MDLKTTYNVQANGCRGVSGKNQAIFECVIKLYWTLIINSCPNIEIIFVFTIAMINFVCF